LKKTAIIVAGGTGTRMQAGIPKQFMLLSGKPVLMHTLNAFAAYDAGMVLLVTLPLSFIQDWKALCRDYTFEIPHRVIEGGATRFHSVRNALHHTPDDSWVAIHDGVRPLVQPSLIRFCFEEALVFGNAVPVVALNESLRTLEDNSSGPEDRTKFRLVQTPQVFQAAFIKKAYAREYQPEFTDDATVYESLFEKIHLIDGDPKNIKITHPDDLLIAEALFMAMK